jgi:dTMP kinase
VNPAGLLLTLDGPGGVGKSTTHRLLAHTLTQAGHHVHATAQPSHSPLGQTVRALGGSGELTGRALALAVAADRHHQIATEINPALDSGHTVLVDRYLPSTLVLQRQDGVDTSFLLTINQGIPTPHLAVVLLADAPTIHARLQTRGTRHRFERDTDDTRRELALYEDAIPILERLGYPLLRVDVTHHTPTTVIHLILQHLDRTPATVKAVVPPR